MSIRDETSTLLVTDTHHLTTERLLHSYRHCDTVCRQQASSFYPAFRLLPGTQRRAMCALYAFFRIADDLSDEPGSVEDKQHALADWRNGLAGALQGDYSHDIHPALHHTVTKHAIPPRYLEAVLDGVEMDLHPTAFQTFDDLYHYCYHVASVVGIACIHVWGFTDVRAKMYAEKAGIAFQLTNILRDLSEDAARGRVYLPNEDFQRFDYAAERLADGVCDDKFRDLMAFQVHRARRFYQEAWPLLSLLPPAGRAVFGLMARTYRALLNKIEVLKFDVFQQRVRVSRWHKMFLYARAFPARWGWSVFF